MESWYYEINKKQKGPVSPIELKFLFTNGILKNDTLVWKQGLSNWIRYEDTGNLQSASQISGETINTFSKPFDNSISLNNLPPSLPGIGMLPPLKPPVSVERNNNIQGVPPPFPSSSRSAVPPLPELATNIKDGKNTPPPLPGSVIPSPLVPPISVKENNINQITPSYFSRTEVPPSLIQSTLIKEDLSIPPSIPSSLTETIHQSQIKDNDDEVPYELQLILNDEKKKQLRNRMAVFFTFLAIFIIGVGTWFFSGNGGQNKTSSVQQVSNDSLANSSDLKNQPSISSDGQGYTYTNLSEKFDYRIIVKKGQGEYYNGEYGDSIIKTITVDVINKSNQGIKQTIVMDGKSFDRTLDFQDKEYISSRITGVKGHEQIEIGDGDNFMVGDFNLDDREDFGIKERCGNGGCFYKICTLRKDGLFKEDTFLTNETNVIDKKNRIISTFDIDWDLPNTSHANPQGYMRTFYSYNLKTEVWDKISTTFTYEKGSALNISFSSLFKLTSLDAIYNQFGKYNVELNPNTDLVFGDIVPTEYIIYKGSDREFSILFDDSEVKGFVFRKNYKANYLSLPLNLKPGLLLNDVYKINKGSFTFNIFLKNINWQNGQLENYKNCIDIQFATDDNDANMKFYKEIFPKYGLNTQIKSDDENISSYNIKVDRIIFFCPVL